MALSGTLLADFSAFVSEAQGATRAVLGMQNTAEDAAKKLSTFAEGFNVKSALTDPVGTATEGMKAFAGVLGPTAVAAAGVVTTVVALGTAMYGLATSAAETVAQFDDLHDKTGLSVPALSALSNAAQVIGADLGTLTNVVFKLEQGIGENTDKFQAGLEAMGLSTNELKAAGPDRYLELVTQGLQNIADPSARAAAGTAVLGKGYKDVAAALNDLGTGMKLTADIEPFTAQQAADAEAFQFQINSLKTHVGDLATKFGMELIPAVSAGVSVLVRTGEALAHIADLGGLVSGAWHGIKLSVGEAALQQETMLALQESTNRLFMEQGATAESVAEKMLTLGYSEKTVAEQTGLTADQVRQFNIALNSAKKEADDYDALWERVNKKLGEAKPALDEASASTKGLAADMIAAKVPIKDIEAATGLTADQIAELTKQITDNKKAVEDWKKATENIAAAQESWQTTLDTLDGAVAEAIRWDLSIGVSQADAAKSYGVTAKQVESVKISLEEYAATLASTADFETDAAKRRQEITAATTKATNDQILAQFKATQAEAEFYTGAITGGKAVETSHAQIQAAIKTTTDLTQAGLDATLKKAQQVVSDTLAIANAARDFSGETQAKLDAEVTASSEAFYQANLQVKGSADSTATSVGNAYTQGFGRAQQASSNFRSSSTADAAAVAAAAAAATATWETAQGRIDAFNTKQAANPGNVLSTVGMFGGMQYVQTRDTGGPVTAGTPYLIGGGKEPELFVPGASGYVTPNAGGAGRGFTVTNVFNIVDTEANITRRGSANITRSIMAAQKL